jgi:hypothetical protein
VRKIPLPISQIVIEDVQVDIARLNNPDLRGKAYQQSNRMDENLRIATLMRDGYQCTQCKEKKSLDAHHIIWREDGGKDTIENLITLCKQCHKKVHKGKLKLLILGVLGFKDRIAQRTMPACACLPSAQAGQRQTGKGVGRVRYQVNAQLAGFRKGDIVRVKWKWVKQINSIYSNGYLAFARVKGSPNCAKPKDLKLLQKGQCEIWEKWV